MKKEPSGRPSSVLHFTADQECQYPGNYAASKGVYHVIGIPAIVVLDCNINCNPKGHHPHYN